LARSYLYISTTYDGVFTCCDTPATNGSHIKPWLETLLRKWHGSDPVSTYEQERNEAVFGIQNNRLAFIDHPEWVDLIPDF